MSPISLGRIRGIGVYANVGPAYINDSDGGVKPVINLKPQAIMYGNGKMDNPYRLTSKIK